MNSAQEQAEQLRAHLLTHVTAQLTEGTDEYGTPEILLVALGRNLTNASEALFELDRLNGGLVKHTTEYTRAPDQITLLYANSLTEWRSHTWWSPNLTPVQCEIYTRLRSDGMDPEQAKLCAVELGGDA